MTSFARNLLNYTLKLS